MKEQAAFKKRERMSRVCEVSNDQLLGKVAVQRHNFSTAFSSVCWYSTLTRESTLRTDQRGQERQQNARVESNSLSSRMGSETFCKKFSELRW